MELSKEFLKAIWMEYKLACEETGYNSVEFYWCKTEQTGQIHEWSTIGKYTSSANDLATGHTHPNIPSNQEEKEKRNRME